MNKKIDNLSERQKLASSVFMQNYGFVRYIALINAPEQSLCDDIVNDVFINFIENAEDWDETRDPKPYLKAITVNKANDHWRIHLRNMPDALAKLVDYVREEAVQETDDRHNVDQYVQTLNQCLDKLSPRCREYIVKRYFDTIPTREIAKEAHVNLDNLYKIMAKIRLTLKACIEGMPEGSYIVTVSLEKVVYDRELTEEERAQEKFRPGKVYTLIEKNMTDEVTSPLKIEVKPGKNEYMLDVGKKVEQFLYKLTPP